MNSIPSSPKTWTRLLFHDTFIAFLLFIIFFLVTGYHYGWDDQHLEIPLLKHLINPELYAGDYYVESLKKNFSSFFYPILARLITVDQIPSVYFVLFVLSRYALIFWIYKLWRLITPDRIQAFCCVLMFILVMRVDEFLYRTFSHQEFALAIIFAGIYYFFKERYYLAAILLGIAANIHALYSLFPMLFILAYLLISIRKNGWKKLIGSGLIFTVGCIPFVIWTLKNKFSGSGGGDLSHSDWLPLYITSCPQNFFFPRAPTVPWSKIIGSPEIFFALMKPYLLLAMLFFVNLFVNSDFRKNGKAIVFSIGAFALVGVCFIFTYLKPHPFAIDLNLCRNTQFLTFLLAGFIVIGMMKTIEKGSLLAGLGTGLMLTFLKYDYKVQLSALGIFAIIAILTNKYSLKESKSVPKRVIVISSFMIIPLLWVIFNSINTLGYTFFIRANMSIIFLLLVMAYFILKFLSQRMSIAKYKRIFFIIPFLIFFFQYSVYSYQKQNLQKTGDGFWKMQRSWEDMQRFVKENTEVDATLLVPYNMEMGGFRIQSEREIICSFRDCGIIGFDYDATLEWKQRVNDIYPFKVLLEPQVDKAIQNAILKYNANYIVFMRYASPSKDTGVMHRIYTNSDFVLYKIMR